MLIWVVSGNFPTAWVCVLGSVLLTAHLLLLLAPSSWSILSVKVPSLMQCLLESRARSTTCSSSKQNTISSCILSICSAWLGYLVAASLVLCTEVWLRLHSFVKQLKTSHKTTDTSSDKKKRHTTS